MHPARLPEEALLAEVQARPLRSGGPGGQHRNRNATGVLLVHRPSGIEASATERRNRKDNHREALLRLRKRLAVKKRTAIPEGKPSSLWKDRLRGGKMRVNPDHADFPALLAEVLDLLAFAKDDLAAVAGILETSTSQLVRLLGQEPAALVELNARRSKAGLKPLRSS